MSTKLKGFFKKLLGTTMAAACLLSGTAVAGTVASSNSISAAAAATTNSPATFSWDNATVYFLLTDRFCNGDTSNDNAYGRQNINVGDRRATFHGGDFAGITKKINEGYFDDLGVNAIWLTAPYEQIHGYIQGGSNFWHYSYHGYYVLDYTEPDKAYGTADEFKTLVDTAHKHGIRIIMDIVLNHAGYNSMKDMSEFGFGTLLSGWDSYYNNPPTGDTSAYHNYIDYKSSQSDWGKWWGNDWIRSGLPGYDTSGEGASERIQSLEGLPDFRTEKNQPVGLPTFLSEKWKNEGTFADKARKYGTSNTVTGFISSWLADWVRTYGVDGFRCDTAKHVEYASWKQLKEACVAALKEWKTAHPNDKLDDLEFWMTGEHWDHGCYKDAYYTEGGFNSMINFETQGGGLLAAGRVSGVYEGYAQNINSDPSFNVLSYISSHDSVLARGDQYYLGSALLLLPGGVQIYYGDESNRQLVPGVPVAGDGHAVRSDMNWDSLDTGVVKHWGIVGRFRNSHIAVGAGQHTTLTASNGIGVGRTYSGNGITDTIAAVIGASANTDVTLDLGGLWPDGTMLTNYYDDSSATVSGGKITFNSGAHGTILIAEPDGTKGRVTVTHINQDTGATIKTETLAGLVGDSYTTTPLTTEGFTVAKTVGKTTGVYAETDAEVTYYYTFDSNNYAYIEVKHVDAASGSELAASETTAAKIGTTYSVSPKDIKDYEVDLTKTTNATGTVAKGTTTVTFYYNYVEPTNLRVHYYNANGWSTVKIYAYDESGATVKEFTGAWASATAMTSEGDGWFFAEVPDTESATVIFHNGAGAQEPAYMQPGYDCSGEVWLKNGKQMSAGKVNVVYASTDGKVLASEKLTGLSGESYTTSAKSFAGYTLSSTPANASGTFTEAAITVTYTYTPDKTPLSNTSNVSASSIKNGSSVTVTCAASGGTAPYTYKVEYKKSSASSYTTLQAYSSTSSVKYTPAAAGNYDIKVTVKDSEGTTSEKSFSLVVEPSSTTVLTNKSTISATSITLGKSVTVTGAASGGTTPYQYAVYYKKSSSTSYSTAQAYSTTKTITIKPSAATTYDVRVKVKDNAGTVKTKDFTVKVSPAATALTNKSTISATSVALGSSVTVTGAAAGGTSPYQYAAYIKKSTASSFSQVRAYSTTKTITIKPVEAGTYTVRIKVKDAKGTVVNKDVTLKATSVLANKSTLSATSVTLGKSITITGKATGGTSPYQYAAYYKKSSSSSYTQIQAFSTNATMTFKPAAATAYDVRVKVKDKAGTIKVKDFTVNVSPATSTTLANSSTLSATSITLGKSITITGKATGGTSPYQYAAYYKKSSSDSYTQIRDYSTTATMTVKPASATTYNIRVKVKDKTGKVVNKDFTVKVTK